MFLQWFGGGANAELPPFAPAVEAATAGRLSHWIAAPLGRLSLIVVLDQFTRGLFLARDSTPEEVVYLEKGGLVYMPRPPK